MSKEIVISVYNENIDWVKNLNLDIKKFIYNKSTNLLEFECKQIPNVGREGETYLRHIIENYESLSENIILCQGNPFEHCKKFIDIVNNNKSNSIQYLSDWSPLVYQYSNSEMQDGIKSILRSFNLPDLKTNDTFSAGAQYLIHRDLILRKSKETWMDIYNNYMTYLDNNDSSNPWIYERIWPIIFNGSSNCISNNLPNDYGKM